VAYNPRIPHGGHADDSPPPAAPVVPDPVVLDPVVLDRVGKRYGRRRGVQALQDVSVSFGRGTFTAVMGISGSGKSTLLQCAAGLERPTAGTVHLLDRRRADPALIGQLATAVVVAGDPSVRAVTGHGDSAQQESLALPSYRRLPASLAGQIATVPGVARAIADVSFPVGLMLPGGGFDGGTAADPLTGHAWASAALTPFRPAAGSPPAGRTGIVVGSGVAAADHLRPGDRVRLAGLSSAPFTVTGVAAARGPAVAGRDSVFFGTAEAAALYGHPGQADLIGVVARPGTTAAALAARIGRELPRADSDGHPAWTLATGSARGALADVAAAGDGSQLEALATGVGIDIVLISLFVVAGAVALSVGLRRREFALLRAVGATSGQVRRGVLIELAVLGVLGGVPGSERGPLRSPP
jgi:putative ABC transport system permease protein